MELFGVGIGEAGLVLLIALLVVGPERFPMVAREGGRWYRMARRFAAEVTADLQGALQELENEVNEQTGELRSVRELSEEVRVGMRETSADLSEIGRGVGTAANADATPADAGPASAAVEPAPPRDTAAAEEEARARVLRAYSEYHTPPPPVPAPVDPDAMSQHAAEAFETFRAGDEPAAPRVITGVNPFPATPAPVVASADRDVPVAGTVEATDLDVPPPAATGATVSTGPASGAASNRAAAPVTPAPDA